MLGGHIKRYLHERNNHVEQSYIFGFGEADKRVDVKTSRAPMRDKIVSRQD